MEVKSVALDVVVYNSRNANARILMELFDALIQEDLFSLQTEGYLTQERPCANLHEDFSLRHDEQYWSSSLNDDQDMLISRVCQRPDLQPWRLSRPPLYYVEQSQTQGLPAVIQVDSAAQLMQYLVRSVSPERLPNLSGFEQFMRDLTCSQRQSAWSMKNTDAVCSSLFDKSVSLINWERLAALRDRPFHPLARAKIGWDVEQYRLYAAESGNSFGLTWLAIRNQHLLGCTQLQGEGIASLVLSDADRQALNEACLNRDIDPQCYSLIPAHPWHLQYCLHDAFKSEFADKHVIVVIDSLGLFMPTSSLRTLIPNNTENQGNAAAMIHLKLPVGISSLGALRLLPPRYLYNGSQAYQLLLSIIRKSPALSDFIRLCDESEWLSYCPEQGSMLSNRAGNLSCLIRRYPDISENYSLPMSALAVMVNRKVPALERLHQHQDKGTLCRNELALNLIEQLSKKLCRLGFICFGFGVMPEIHGQNILLSISNSHVQQLILRDHDTLRCFPPWIKQAQLQEAKYEMDWSTPNSLICLSPQELLSYFQTLGIQVNLFSIADAFSKSYGMPLASFWSCIKSAAIEELNLLPLPILAKAIIRKELIDNVIWPTRMLLTPYLAYKSSPMGMPSGTGTTRNPLHG